MLGIDKSVMLLVSRDTVTGSNQTEDGGRQLLWIVSWEMADSGTDLVKIAPRGQRVEG